MAVSHLPHPRPSLLLLCWLVLAPPLVAAQAPVAPPSAAAPAKPAEVAPAPAVTSTPEVAPVAAVKSTPEVAPAPAVKSASEVAPAPAVTSAPEVAPAAAVKSTPEAAPPAAAVKPASEATPAAAAPSAAASVDAPVSPGMEEEPESLGWTLIRTLFVLGAVVCSIYLTLNVGLRKLMGLQGVSTGRPSVISVVERVPLDPRRTLFVLKAADEYLLVGGGEEGLQLLSKLDTAAVERIRAERPPANVIPLTPFLQKLLSRRTGSQPPSP